ncbi:hypothetical protein TRFO_30103 [Tritrichomonas foetus]|uniref:non-specific serine/threonine protein kinase n=1 Tax=Tritrichomonas foetus TaxID=1144522 RepID=A0A1J4JVF2_9EUKA|nr:hypothetical protein TRFO_30103 [Tritrichomonas foetus]|eukprot:OHT02706.1 hypothetical protein TRFO_30103 [Tritrichomonas foetus]
MKRILKRNNSNFINPIKKIGCRIKCIIKKFKLQGFMIFSLFSLVDENNVSLESFSHWCHDIDYIFSQLNDKIAEFTDYDIKLFLDRFKDMSLNPKNSEKTRLVSMALIIKWNVISKDYFHEILTFIYSKISETNLIIVKICCHFLKSLNSVSKNYQLFRIPLNFVTVTLQNFKNNNESITNCLIILNIAKKVVPIDVSKVLLPNVHLLFEIMTKNDKSEDSFYSLKLMKFMNYYQNYNVQYYFNKSIEILQKEYSRNLLYYLYNLFTVLPAPFHSKNQQILDILMKYPKYISYKIIYLMLKTYKCNFSFPEFIPKLFYQKFHKILILILTSFSKFISPEPIMTYINGFDTENHICIFNSNQNTVKRKKVCIFEVYKALLNNFPNFQTNFLYPKTICIHYMITYKAYPTKFDYNFLKYYFSRLSLIDKNIPILLLFRDTIPDLKSFILSQIQMKGNNYVKELIIDYYSNEFKDILLPISFFDHNKMLRMKALQKLNQNDYFSVPAFLPLLNDRSFKIRRATIKVLSKYIPLNPLDLEPITYGYTKEILTLMSSTSNLQKLSKYATLIAKICKYLKSAASKCSSLIIDMFLTMANRDGNYYLTRFSFNNSNLNLEYNDKNVFSDNVNNNYNYQSNESVYLYNANNFDDNLNNSHTKNVSKNMKESYKLKVLLNSHEKYLYKIDIYLTKAIADLGNLVKERLVDVLNMFYLIFMNRKNNDKLLITCVKSLIELSTKIHNGMNIRLLCPQMLNPLSMIIMNTQHETLIVSILKLIGGSFDYIDVFQTQIASNFINSSSSNADNSYTNFVCKNLMNFIDEPSEALFKTITKVFESDFENAKKYVSNFLPMFLKGMMANKEIFEYTEVLIAACKIDIVLMFDEIVRIIIKNIEYPTCVRFCTCLCHYLKGNFNPSIITIYQSILNRLDEINFEYFKCAIKFCCFAILDSGQDFELLLYTIENLRLTKEQFINKFVKYLSIILTESYDHNFEFLKTRINLLVHSLNRKIIKMNSYQLTYKIKKLSNLKANKNDYFFKDLSFPSEKNSPKFINELTYKMITKSPSGSIRACSDIFTLFPDFIQNLFPFAFYSCWEKASNDDRNHFSQIVDRILAEHDNPNRIFYELIQYVDQCGIPMKINELRVASLSNSPQFSMYLLQKHYIMKDKNDHEITKQLMNVSSKMGHSSITKAYLENISHHLTNDEKAKWHINLGQWDKALEIYTNSNGSIEHIVPCLRNIGRAKEILNYEKEFLSLPKEQQNLLSDCFCWAYSVAKEVEKTEKIIESFEEDWTPMRYVSAVFFSLQQRKLERAEQLIEKGFKLMARNKNVFGCGDQNLLDNYFSTLQLFIESREVLNFLRLKRTDLSQMSQSWNNRIKGFKRDQIAWEKLINLRRIAIPIAPNMHFYTKIISALRKDGQFRLLDRVFGKYYDGRVDNLTLVQRCKILWEMDQKIEAIEALTILVELFGSDLTPIRFRRLIFSEKNYVFLQVLNSYLCDNLMPQGVVDMCLDYYQVKNLSSYLHSLRSQPIEVKRLWVSKLMDLFPDAYYLMQINYAKIQTHHQKSRIYSLYSSYLYRLYPDNIESMINVAKGFLTAAKFEPNNHQHWRNWGYANLRLYSLTRNNPFYITLVSEAYKAKQTKDVDKQAYLPPDAMPVYNSDEDDEISSSLQSEDSIDDDFTKNGDEKICDADVVGTEYGVTFNDMTFVNNDEGQKPVDMTNADIYAINTITGFLKANDLYHEGSLEYLCQVFSVLFMLNNSSTIPPHLYDDLLMLDTKDLISVLPQITAQIAHIDPYISNLVANLLSNFGNDYFQRLFFALNLYVHSSNKIKAKTAKEIIRPFINLNPVVAHEAQMFVDGMCRSAVTLFEHWVHTLENASNLRNNNKNGDANHLLRKLVLKEIEPCCELDRLFLSLFGEYIHQVKKLLIEGKEGEMWSLLSHLYRSMKNMVNKLSVILLTKVSEILASKRHFHLFVPGRYNPDEFIYSIDSVMEVIGTQQHPRCLYLNTTRGEHLKYLLKGNEDLRNDERLMQFFALSNSIFKQSRETRQTNSLIVCYDVIPITTLCGLISWVTGADTFHKMVVDARKQADENKEKEQKELKNNTHNTESKDENKVEQHNEEQNNEKYTVIKNKEIMEKMVKLENLENEIISKYVIDEFTMMTKLQKYELFEIVSETCKANELFRTMWVLSPCASAWMERVIRFTYTTAINSMVGYIIGLGDRHPSNIMIQRDTGSVVHIDFEESFESTLHRKEFPEKVPFRLTRMIENAFEGAMNEGKFQKMCIMIMTVLRENQSILLAQLAIFIHEPLYEAEVVAKRMQNAIDRVDAKLQGIESGDKTSIKEQVLHLIKEAKDPINYVQHYPGWCPFW